MARYVASGLVALLALGVAAGAGPLASGRGAAAAGDDGRVTTAGGMMSLDKLDKALLEEIRERRAGEPAAGPGPGGHRLDQEAFDVTIEVAEPLDVPKGLPRDKALEQLERQAERSQAGVVGVLRSLGVTAFERLPLSNSIAVTLTLEQIRRIAQRDDVGQIRLRKVRKVTAAE